MGLAMPAKLLCRKSEIKRIFDHKCSMSFEFQRIQDPILKMKTFFNDLIGEVRALQYTYTEVLTKPQYYIPKYRTVIPKY